MVALPKEALHAGRIPDNVFTRDDVRRDTELRCDVVIVGSGAGGATAAAELAEGGLDVIVLEEGRYYGTRDFTADASAMIRALYRGGGATAALGSPPIMFQEGIAVGGSTVINGGMSWRTPEDILDRWVREDGLTNHGAKDMEFYFDRVERRIHVREQDPESIGRDNALLKEGADKKGWLIFSNLRNQVHCPGSNNCAFGCPTGAKQSALVSYIPRALHFGARVYSDIRVSKISFDGKRATGVLGRVVDEDGRRGAKVTVRASIVVAACGAIHTPALLHRSGVRSPSGRLGRDLSMHPNVKVVAIFDEQVRGYEGVHQAYQVREFHEQGLVFAAVNMPPSIIGGVGMPHYGAELGELMDDYNRMVIAGMLCEDTSLGRLRMVGGHPVATYQLNDYDAQKLVKGTKLLCELLFEAGAQKILLPFSGPGDLHSADDIKTIDPQQIDKRTMEVLTVHMMGTARMGSDPNRAVTDQNGAVYDADRLFICDAGLFPTPIGVNPMETIQALATRNAHHILIDQERYLS